MAAKYRVEFSNVGRDRASWAVATDAYPDEAGLARMVRKKAVLLSRGIDCFTEEDGTGEVIAGIRAVGTYRIVPLDSPLNGGASE